MLKKIFTVFIILNTVFIINKINVNASTVNENKFVENLSNTNEEISVVIKFDYKNPNFSMSSSDNVKQNQKLITKTRQSNKKYYSKNNDKLIDKLNLDAFNVSISDYSPFVFIEYENYFEYKNDKDTFVKLSKNNLIDVIYVENELEASVEATVNSGDSLDLLPIETAKSMVKVDNAVYDGDGIKVGIIDSGYPDNMTNFSNNEIVAYNTGGTTSEHTTKVASIIGGTYGIAPKTDLYIHKYNLTNSSFGFDDAIEWLLPHGVNVINLSVYSDGYFGNYGKYDGHSAYLDYIVWNNSVSIVKSAGNRGYSDNLVTNPGIGLNTYSVGSVDADKKISGYSSFEVDSSLSGIVMKPTLVAPGENIIIPNTINSQLNSDGTELAVSYSGTSFAAPMVTGIIALLMQEFPRLMLYPEVIMSALVSSASMLPSQNDLWDNEAGAGLINYEAARELLSSSSYINSIVTSSTINTSIILTKTLEVEAIGSVEYALVNIFNHNVISPSGSVYTPNFTKYQIKVYDENGNEVITTQTGVNSNIILGKITNSNSSAMTYTIEVKINGNKISYHNEYLGLTIYQHSHSYNYKHTPSGSARHHSHCHCGATVSRVHAVSSSAIGRYKPCIDCGYLVDTNSDIVIVGP